MVTPALIWPTLDPALTVATRRRATRFKRAEKRAPPAQSLLALTAAALGIEPPPAGALARLAEGLTVEEGESWFRAEPVTLIPDRDHLRLLTLDDAPLDAEEARALSEAACAHFGAQLKLERSPSGRWYASLADVFDAAGEALEAAVAHPIDVVSLADGPDASRLRGFLNELQMLWYEHPVNLARRETGRPEANALWLWGGGRLPARPAVSEPVTLHADAPEAVGLALWLGIARKPLARPERDQPRGGTIVSIGAESKPAGAAWLDAFVASRRGFQLYGTGVEWRIPERRGLRRLWGW